MTTLRDALLEAATGDAARSFAEGPFAGLDLEEMRGALQTLAATQPAARAEALESAARATDLDGLLAGLRHALAIPATPQPLEAELDAGVLVDERDLDFRPPESRPEVELDHPAEVDADLGFGEDDLDFGQEVVTELEFDELILEDLDSDRPLPVMDELSPLEEDDFAIGSGAGDFDEFEPLDDLDDSPAGDDGVGGDDLF